MNTTELKHSHIATHFCLQCLRICCVFLLSDFYENSALMLEEEGAVIVGLLVGLNVIDANLCVKGEDLDSQVTTALRQYLTDWQREDTVTPSNKMLPCYLHFLCLVAHWLTWTSFPSVTLVWGSRNADKNGLFRYLCIRQIESRHRGVTFWLHWWRLCPGCKHISLANANTLYRLSSHLTECDWSRFTVMELCLIKCSRSLITRRAITQITTLPHS